MPNCIEQDCKNYVVAEGLQCRIHQTEGGDVRVMVTYMGNDITVVDGVGVFQKNTTAEMPGIIAAKYRGNSDWRFHDEKAAPPPAKPQAKPKPAKSKKGPGDEDED